MPTDRLVGLFPALIKVKKKMSAISRIFHMKEIKNRQVAMTAFEIEHPLLFLITNLDLVESRTWVSATAV